MLVGEGRVSFHHPDIFDDRAVARINPHAVDLDRTGGGHEIPVTLLTKGIVNGFTDLQRSAQHARLSADWQRLIVVIEAARERHEARAPPHGRVRNRMSHTNASRRKASFMRPAMTLVNMRT